MIRVSASLLAILLLLASVAFAKDPVSLPRSATEDDPYLWLEDIGSAKATDFVKTANDRSWAQLGQLPKYQQIYQRLLAIYNDKARIPYVTQMGKFLYNFWKDEANPRGLWRRASWADYRQEKINWTTVLDLDELSKIEKENWVWKGASCLPPAYRRCLLSLSRGGGDAVVIREFDIEKKAFIADGFELPEAKGGLSWVDDNTVLAATDFGPGTMTDSGYARLVKTWHRGSPLSAATTLFAGQTSDVHVYGYKEFTPGHEHELVVRAMTFWTNEVFLHRQGQLTRLDKPDDADATVFGDWLLLSTRSSWTVGDRTFPAGALLAMPIDGHHVDNNLISIIFTPSPTTSLEATTHTRDQLLLTVLDNVKTRVFEVSLQHGTWQRREIPMPGLGTGSATPVDALASNQYFLSFQDFLTPSSLYLGGESPGALERLKSAPVQFVAKNLRVQQSYAKSRDGAMIPYFIVGNSDLRADGRNPTLLYGYGGFEVALTPTYSGGLGASWLEAGGTYVLANIRGGGEFGPSWHQAALKANRQRAYDDFAAVAEDLVARKVTTPRYLAIEGGSNGGLLVGAVLVQRPELFHAAVCQVPLLDMKRYNHLLAGASWMGEYGDPDEPQQWAYISKYSPYQNVKKGITYPKVLFLTSTRDDRVHPGHARKMYAKMKDLGADVLYYENTEGGHAGAANNAQQAKMWALTYAYLRHELMD